MHSSSQELLDATQGYAHALENNEHSFSCNAIADIKDLLSCMGETLDHQPNVESVFIELAKVPIMGRCLTCYGLNQDEVVKVQVAMVPGNGRRVVSSLLVDDAGKRSMDTAECIITRLLLCPIFKIIKTVACSSQMR